MSTTRSSFSALALAFALVASGCGEDDASTAVTTTTAADDPSTDAVAVTAVDYEYQDLPGEVAAGSTISLRNDSDGEIHELVALRLGDDETRSVDELLSLPPDELEALFTAPPALVLVAPPGERGFAAVGTGTVTEPGRYLATCFIPTGADPQAYLDALEADPGQPPAVEGGPPHFTAGMYQEVTVR